MSTKMDANTTDRVRTAFAGQHRLLLDDRRFEQARRLIEQPRAFNLFEAIGVTNQELRHSAFLAALLNPTFPHGLGDSFLRSIVTSVLTPAQHTMIDPAALCFDAVTVRREWQNIDILIESPSDRLVIVIENKIWTNEHSNQLERYRLLVQTHYRDWRQVFLFLTPDGMQPSDRHYHVLDYNAICRIINRLIATAPMTLDPAVLVTLEHYIQMLRRHIVFDADSEEALLARRLYRDHEPLISTLLKQREQRHETIRATIKALVAQTGGRLQLDSDHINGQQRWFTRFAPAAWYTAPHLRVSNWTKTHLIVMFQFMHTTREIVMDLAVGADRKRGMIRQTIFDLAAANQPPFYLRHEAPVGYFTLYGRAFMPEGADWFAEYTDAQLREAIVSGWTEFMLNDLPAIEEVFARTILRDE
jgi:hypothetical protein